MYSFYLMLYKEKGKRLWHLSINRVTSGELVSININLVLCRNTEFLYLLAVLIGNIFIYEFIYEAFNTNFLTENNNNP